MDRPIRVSGLAGFTWRRQVKVSDLDDDLFSMRPPVAALDYFTQRKNEHEQPS